MAQLTEDQKFFLLRRTARFERIKHIKAEFLTEFGVEVSEEQASAYDASTKAGMRDLRKEYQDFFWEVRDDFLDVARSIDVFHPAVRLRLLRDLLDHKIAKAVPKETRAILEQIAKECGGMYEQRQAGGSKPDDVAAYTRELMLKVRAAVEKVLPDDEEARQPVLEAIQGCLAEISPQ